MTLTYSIGEAEPTTFVSDGFSASFTQTYGIGPPVGQAWLFTEVDVAGTAQPQNGQFSASFICDGCGTGFQQLVLWEQSTNFPGPHYWRGAVPFYFGSNQITVTGTVGFVYRIVGLIIPEPRRAHQA